MFENQSVEYGKLGYFIEKAKVLQKFPGNGARDNEAATSDRAAWTGQKVL